MSLPPVPSHRPVRFFHRGRVVELTDPPGTRSVLEWLREDAHCTGTKEGCAEGDCGACTVVLGRLDEQQQLQLEPVNSCIQFLPTLDGKALFTVEDLQQPGGSLHPVQQSMRDCHGSQCGFCTPGFVMSLWASSERHRPGTPAPTRQQLADDIAGNLCRCTGYRPILDAAQQAFVQPPQRLDRAPVVAALKTLASEPPLQLAERWFAPRTLDEFASLAAAHPDARILAGSTDIGLWVNKQHRVLPKLLFIGAVAELQRIDETGGELHIGAAASLEAAWQALARRWPSLHEMWLRFASPPVRFAGTMGGNVANGSPIGDSAPVLMALGARLQLRCGSVQREVALEDFYLGYMKNALQPGEFVQAIVVPRQPEGAMHRAYKISKRFDSDISALALGARLVLDAGHVHDVRLAYGGLAAVVQRAAAAEAALRGQPWSEATVRAAMAAIAQDFRPLTDHRASAAYRLQVAQNLLWRLWLETRPANPLPAQAVSVFAREVSA